jgi:hypothetical protein
MPVLQWLSFGMFASDKVLDEVLDFRDAFTEMPTAFSCRRQILGQVLTDARSMPVLAADAGDIV